MQRIKVRKGKIAIDRGIYMHSDLAKHESEVLRINKVGNDEIEVYDQALTFICRVKAVSKGIIKIEQLPLFP